jgi:crotonobetainyl-CoA:carnitine CoA-transferase CaiB-like acyl-CoA transferase
MWMNGDPGDPPSFFGTPLADSNAGVHAFGAIGAALHRRARTGEGTHIDLSSYDALVTMIDAALVLHSFTRGERRMTGFGTRHTLVVPAATVRTADGEYVAYGTPGDAMFRRLAAAMERPELAESAEYGTSEARVTNQDALYALIEEWGSGFDTAAELIEQLARHGVSGARIRTYVEAAEDPHLIERGTLAPVAIAGLGDVLVPSAPHHMTGARVAPRGPAPALGEHTREILSEVLGLPDTEIQAFIDDGVVNAAEEVTHVR